MRGILAFLAAIPELLKFVKLLESRIREAKVQRKVSDDVKAIHAAFENNDTEALNALFNSK